MGIYSETLLRREKENNRLERTADELLRTGKGGLGGDPLEKTERTLRVILKRFGKEAIKPGSCQTTEELLDAMLDPEGIMYEKLELSDGQWKRQLNLLLAFYKDGTPVILYPALIGYRCYCPSTERREWVGKKTALQETAYAIYRPMEAGRFSIRKFLGLMLRFLSFRDLLGVAAATALISGLGLIQPAVNRYVLDDLISEGPSAGQKLLATAFVFLMAGLLKGAVSVIKTALISGMKLRISTQTQAAVLSRVLLMPYEYFQNGSVGRQSVQIRSARSLADLLIGFMMNNLLSVVFALMYIPQMHSLSPVLVWPALGILLLEVTVTILLSLASAKNTAEQLEYSQDADTLMFEFFKGIQKIKGVGAEKRTYAMAAERYQRVLGASLEPSVFIRLNDTILSGISSFSTLCVLAVAAAAGISRADYIAFVSSYGLLSSAVDALVSMSGAMLKIRPQADQMRQLFDYQPRRGDGSRYVRSLSGNLAAEDLCFAYDKGKRGCVDHVSFQIRRGEKVAFVGESGCGKSTLLKLMLGMLIPDEGSITCDGMPISAFNQRSFRKRVGSVFQFSRLFPGTIYENITFTAPGASLEDAWAAAEAACIAEDIRKLPLGMDTEVSEGNGGGFSGGQKQRLLLARAFAQKPSILILDEATSALDNLSQHHVLSAVYQMPCTVLMVAHRLSTVKGCDRIFVLKDGRIAEEGSYEELMAKNAEFARLVRKQQTS